MVHSPLNQFTMQSDNGVTLLLWQSEYHFKTKKRIRTDYKFKKKNFLNASSFFLIMAL